MSLYEEIHALLKPEGSIDVNIGGEGAGDAKLASEVGRLRQQVEKQREAIEHLAKAIDELAR